jgi:hypothetical protein
MSQLRGTGLFSDNVGRYSELEHLDETEIDVADPIAGIARYQLREPAKA